MPALMSRSHPETTISDGFNLPAFLQQEPTTARWRYFVAEGSQAAALIDRILAAEREYRIRLRNLLTQFNTAHYVHRDGLPTRIVLEDGQAIPDGLKIDGRRQYAGKDYLELKPLLNTDAGRAIKRQMDEVGKFNISEIITKHYACESVVVSGTALWAATGRIHTTRKIILVQVPEDDETPYTPHPAFREIREAEYVVMTKE